MTAEQAWVVAAVVLGMLVSMAELWTEAEAAVDVAGWSV